MKLYSFYRSSASYRARIVLHLKGIPFETVGVHLNRDGGDQNKPAYRAVNPHGRVPALQLDDGTVIGQSMAIVDYLETIKPDPSIYPADPTLRGRATSVAFTIVSDIHPLNNIVVMDYLTRTFGADENARLAWYGNWIRRGFAAIEPLIDADAFAFGDVPTIADICIVPQVLNARRFNVDISDFPRILKVDANAAGHPAFVKAHPVNQPDAE